MGRGNALLEAPSRKLWLWVNFFAAFLIITVIQFRSPGAGLAFAGALGENAGSAEVGLLLIISVLGTYVLISLGRLLEKVPYASSGLAWFGRHSLTVILLHTSVMHVIKDLLRVPQNAPTDPAFAARLEPGKLLAYVLTVITVSLLIRLLEHFKILKTV